MSLHGEKLRAALEQEPGRRGPDCLRPEALMLLIEQGAQARHGDRMLAHIAACAVCRREYGSIRKMLRDATEIREARTTLSAPTIPEPSITDYRSEPVGRRRLAADRFAVPAISLASGFALAAITVWMPMQRQVDRVRQQSTEHAQRLQSVLNAERQARSEQTQRQEIIVQDLRTKLAHTARTVREMSSFLPSARDLAPPAQQIAALKPREAGNLMGATAAPLHAAISPVGTLVATDRPLFRWQSVPGATGYAMYIETLPDHQNVVRQEVGRNTEWTPERPLRYGRDYQWSVTAQLPGSPGRDSLFAAFGILPRAQVQQLQKLNDLHLKLGDAYTHAYLFDDAEREYSAVPTGDPRYPIAQERLRVLEARRHLQ